MTMENKTVNAGFFFCSPLQLEIWNNLRLKHNYTSYRIGEMRRDFPQRNCSIIPRVYLSCVNLKHIKKYMNMYSGLMSWIEKKTLIFLDLNNNCILKNLFVLKLVKIIQAHGYLDHVLIWFFWNVFFKAWDMNLKRTHDEEVEPQCYHGYAQSKTACTNMARAGNVFLGPRVMHWPRVPLGPLDLDPIWGYDKK